MSTKWYISASRHQIDVAARTKTSIRPGGVHCKSAGRRRLLTVVGLTTSSYSAAEKLPRPSCLRHRITLFLHKVLVEDVFFTRFSQLASRLPSDAIAIYSVA